MRLISPLLLILCLAGCQHGGSTNDDAVRQAVIDRLAQQKFDLAAMDIKVSSVKYNGDEADATVSFGLKGKSDAPPMNMPYHLKRQGSKWVVTALAGDGGHGGASGGGATNPHGGAMPPATGGGMPPAGGGGNPHGGMAPAGGAGSMPSPNDLPPATKK